MKVVYSRRALADLASIAAHYTASASPTIAGSIGKRLEAVIDRICRMPESAPKMSQRSQIRVVAVIRYPFRIFYRVRKHSVDILHVRHTSRRPLDRLD